MQQLSPQDILHIFSKIEKEYNEKLLKLQASYNQKLHILTKGFDQEKIDLIKEKLRDLV